MEHRLIQGGEQFLPFARSCVAKLKKLGLPYADQSYEVDGVSIKVRIEPGHEYIRLEGGPGRTWMLYQVEESTFQVTGYLEVPAEPVGMDPPAVMPSGDVAVLTTRNWLCRIGSNGRSTLVYEGATQVTTTHTYGFGATVMNGDELVGLSYYVTGQTISSHAVGGKYAITSYCVYGDKPVLTFTTISQNYTCWQYGNGYDGLNVHRTREMVSSIKWGGFSETHTLQGDMTIVSNAGGGSFTTVSNDVGSVLIVPPYFVDPISKTEDDPEYAVACFTILTDAKFTENVNPDGVGYSASGSSTQARRRLQVAGDRSKPASISDADLEAPLARYQLVPRTGDYSRREVGAYTQGHDFICLSADYYHPLVPITGRDMSLAHSYVAAVPVGRNLTIAPTEGAAMVNKFAFFQWSEAIEATGATEARAPGWYQLGKPIDITKVPSLGKHHSVVSPAHSSFGWYGATDLIMAVTDDYVVRVYFKRDQKDAFDKQLPQNSV